MNIALAVVGLFYLFCMWLVLSASWRNSVTAAPVILFFEHFSVLGLGVAPILIGLGIVEINLVSDYLSINGGFTFTMYFHVIGLGIGSLTGYFVGRRSKLAIATTLINTTSRISIDQQKVFWVFLYSALFFYVLFIGIVGADIAIGKAFAARSGFIDQMGEGAAWAFLRRLVYCGIFVAIFIPYIMARKQAFWPVVIFSIFGVALYSITVARVAFLETIGMCALIYICLHKMKIRTLASLIVLAPIFYFILFFGKEFIFALSSYLFEGKELELVSAAERAGDSINAFFGNFVHLLVSIDSGVRYFSEYGTFLPLDTMLAPFSILPSKVYSVLGIEFINYQFVDDAHRMPCINTSMILGAMSVGCSIPPYMHGYSAYFLPVLGGVIFSHLRFYIYAVLQTCFSITADDFKNLWLPFLILILLLNILTMIPSVVSLQFFILAVIVFLILARAIFIVKVARQ